MSDAKRESRTLRDALADFSTIITALQSAVLQIAEQVGDDPMPHLSGDQLESAWNNLCLQNEKLESNFAQLSESAEDAMDVADALAARAEAGEAVSLEELKAELGIE